MQDEYLDDRSKSDLINYFATKVEEEGCFGDAKADWRNGCKKSNYFRRNQMAQVTYRGVKYDTNDSKTQQTNKVDLVYRGVKLEKELVANKWC